MINLKLTGVSNTFASFNFLNIPISINKGKEKKKIKPEISEPIKMPEYTDRKSTLNGWRVDLIENINEDVILYLFIQKDVQYSAWNLLMPILLHRISGKIYQYDFNCFVLQGVGGGLSNTVNFFYYLRQLKQKGFQVSIVAKVTDSNLMNSFEYADSGIKLNDLIESSVDLINYRKNEFMSIYEKYQELITEFQL